MIGHAEWVTFAQVGRVPPVGSIVEASASWEDAGGGGAVAAAQVARLTGNALFVTALGDDDAGAWVRERLEELGVEVRAEIHDRPQRLAFTHLDSFGERTITVTGDPLAPTRAPGLDGFDAAYLVSGTADAARDARRARVLVASALAAGALAEAGVQADVLVHSAEDGREIGVAERLVPPARHVVSTLGGQGGRWTGPDGTSGAWRATPLDGPIGDAYGLGDSFAAGLTVGLGRGDELAAALDLAARCGAACLTGSGPFERQLAA